MSRLTEPKELRELAGNFRERSRSGPRETSAHPSALELMLSENERQRSTIYSGVAAVLEACADRIEELERLMPKVNEERIGMTVTDRASGVDDAVTERAFRERGCNRDR